VTTVLSTSRRGPLAGRGLKTADLFFLNHLAALANEDSFWPGVGFGLGAAVVYDPANYGELTSQGSIWWAGSLGTSYWIDAVEQIVGVVIVQVRPFGYAGVVDRVQKAVYSALVDARSR
jgi:CubicO group peptidase (beta-lactamase class C family)